MPGVVLGGHGVVVHGVVVFGRLGFVVFGFVLFGFVDPGFVVPGVPVGGAVFGTGGTPCGFGVAPGVPFGFVVPGVVDPGCDGLVWFCGLVVPGGGALGVCGAVAPGALAPGAVEPGADCATIHVALRNKTASSSNFLIDMIIMMPSKETNGWPQLMLSVGRRVRIANPEYAVEKNSRRGRKYKSARLRGPTRGSSSRP